MVPPHNKSAPSDARYIFILFALIFVVLFFAFLIYFVYGQKQFARTNGTTKEVIPSSETIDTVRTGAELAPVNTAPTPSVATPTPTAFDPTRYNPRTVDTIQLRGRQLLDKYFSSIQSADYQTACSLLSNTLCNARRDIYTFSQFLGKTNG